MTDTNYETWSQPALVAEVKRRTWIDADELDGKRPDNLSMDTLRGVLYIDDFYALPCNCPACSWARGFASGRRDFLAGRWNTMAARHYIGWLEAEAAHSDEQTWDHEVWRYMHVKRLREQMTHTVERARRAEPGAPEREVVRNHLRWLRESERRWRMRERPTKGES
jgi:hypothetical protein